MAKKSFKTNPAMSFISQETIDRVDGKPEQPKTTPKKKATAPKRATKAPEGYKPNPEYIEKKSKKVLLLVQPSLYEAVKAKAQAKDISTNEAIGEALRQYIEER